LNAGYDYAGVEFSVRLSPLSHSIAPRYLSTEPVLLRLIHQSRCNPRRHLQLCVQRRRYVLRSSAPTILTYFVPIVGTCGGDDAIDIYKAVTAPCVTPWTFRGCYPDSIATRTLSAKQILGITNNSVASCQASCLDAGYRYAGVEDFVGNFFGVNLWR
jgi:hypothetical protein